MSYSRVPSLIRFIGVVVRFILIPLFLFACTPKIAPQNIASTGETLKTPEPSSFAFGPGDKLSIKVWRHEEMDMEVIIAPDGGITYPLIGRIQAAGLTYPELVTHLEAGIKEYYKDVSIAVNILEVSNQKVFVFGEVKTPAVLQITNDLSIVEALTRTGGINSDAKTSNVLLIRGGIENPELFTVDVDAIYQRGDLTQLVYLQRGDIVVVPPKTITNVERFFKHIQGVLSPFVGGSAIYRNAISGGAQGTTSAMD